jgi:tRNA pseudouridine55 synthase
VSGVLLLDKPPGLSSNSAVGWAKRLFQAEKAGHTGTLDPFATGLLPICLGEATKFSRFILDAEKGYRATLKLGQRSSTGDTEGEISAGSPVSIDEARVKRILADFRGPMSQIPPMHSALKRDGVPMYKLARQGIEVDRQPRSVIVHQIQFEALSGDELIIETLVSKGTYIRVLAQDIGEAIGCGAYLTGLRRTSTGGMRVADAITFEELDALSLSDRDALLLPPESLAAALPEVKLDEGQAMALQNGQVPKVRQALDAGTEYRVRSASGGFLGIARASADGAGESILTVVRMMAGTPPPVETD